MGTLGIFLKTLTLDSMPNSAITRSGLTPLPIPGSVSDTPVKTRALDSAAMLDLHDWLNRRRFRLFGDLRPSDQQDAVEETFIRTLEFADKMRDPGALYGACFTIGLRVRAAHVTEYIRERYTTAPGVVPLVPWHPERRLLEKDRRTSVLLAIRSLRASDQEILLRFYFKGQTQEQIQLEMKLTATQFRVRKNRAINRALPRARAILADVRITRSSGNGAGLEFLLFKKFDT
jgi:DNA-directed RNA polymerase specialized sigma24 family protein